MDEKQLAEIYPESYNIKEDNELLTVLKHNIRRNKMEIKTQVKIINKESAFYNEIGELFKNGNGNMISVLFKNGIDVYFDKKDIERLDN